MHIKIKCLTIIFYSIFFFFVVNLPIYASQTTLYFGSTEKTLEKGETKVYIPVASSTVVKTIKNDGTTSTSYLYSNHLGSTVLSTKENGTLDSSLEYYPYGEEITTISTNTDKLYTGQRKDDSSNLYFYNARYYNPQTSHFISADKAEGPNRYAYVGNNPVMRNDPSGNQSASPPISASGVYGGTIGYGAGSGAPIYLPDDFNTNEDMLVTAGLFAAPFVGAGAVLGGYAAAPVIYPLATSIYITSQQFLHKPGMQTANAGVQFANTAGQAACSGGSQAGCAVAAFSDPLAMAGGMADPGYIEYENHIKQGAQMINEGNPQGAIEHFQQPELAEKVGMRFDRSPTSVGIPGNIDPNDYQYIANLVASQSMFWTDKGGKIQISSVFSYEPNTFKPIPLPDVLAHEVACVGCEEWSHGLQNLRKDTLTGYANHEVDVAAYMQNILGIRLTDTFLKRYEGRSEAINKD